MKRGSFPGQEEALRARAAELKQQADQRATRRLFLGLGLGGVLGSVSGGIIGFANGHRQSAERVSASEQVSEDSADLRVARRLATGPLEKLLGASGKYMVTVRQARHVDDVLWAGVIRLANAFVERHPKANRHLDRLVLLAEKRNDVPEYMQVWCDLVRANPR